MATQRSSWGFQRTVASAAWIGVGVMLVFAIVLATQRSKLPTTIWEYDPGSKGSAPSLDTWSTSFAYGLAWISVAAYFVLQGVLTYVWWRLRANEKRASGAIAGMLVVSVAAFVLINTVVANVIPQLSGVPETRAAANDELSAAALVWGGAFLGFAALALVAGCLISRRTVWPLPRLTA